MNRKHWSWALVAGLSVCHVGCRSTLLETYSPARTGQYQATEKIAALPVLAGGISITPSVRQELETTLDKALTKRWESRFVPLSQSRQTCEPVLTTWTAQMTGDFDLATRLRINAALCQDLYKASGCRYAVLPTVGRCNSDAVNILNFSYVIGGPGFIIVDTIPIFLGKYVADDVSVCTMTLLDLKEARILTEAAMASRDGLSGAITLYPEPLLNAVVRGERIQQRKKQP